MDKGRGAKSSSSSSSSNSDRRTEILLGGKRSETAIKVWQRRYCEYHISQGHAGYCYAWLDNAFCPQFHLTGSCRLQHAHPATWTRDQMAQHDIQIDYMKDLWKDSSLFEANSDVDNDSDYDEPVVSSGNGSLPTSATTTAAAEKSRAAASDAAIANVHQLPTSSTAATETSGGGGRERPKRRRIAE